MKASEPCRRRNDTASRIAMTTLPTEIKNLFASDGTKLPVRIFRTVTHRMSSSFPKMRTEAGTQAQVSIDLDGHLLGHLVLLVLP
ncbi:hypothetical protein [Nocardia seriolae]|nr:hypothetical protein [Nocardia seriolae]